MDKDNNNKLSEYDPFQIPANIEQSLKHQKASKCGTPQEKSELCLCCGREVEQDLKSLNISPIDLSFLGQGIPLFYQFLLQMTLLIILIFFIMGIFSIVTNSISNNCLNNESELLNLYQQGFCKENCPASDVNLADFLKITQILQTQECSIICGKYKDICTTISTNKIAFINKQFENGYKEIQAILVLCSIIIFKIIFILFRRHQKLTQDECDRGLISASDFTAMLTKLPSNNYTEEELNIELIKFCKQVSDIQIGEQFEIIKINIAYNISEYISLVRNKSDLEKQYQINQASYNHNQTYPKNITAETQKQLQDEIKQLEIQLENIDNDVQQKNFNQTTQVAFVTFQTRQQLDSILSYTKLTEWQKVWIFILKIFGKTYQNGFYFKGHLIQFIRAPEPDDIFWENCGYNLDYKVKQRLLSWIITLLLLITSFFILFGLDYLQNNYLSEQNINYVILTILSLIISFIISIINGMIYISITYLGKREKHYTKTHYDVSVATKLIYVQFVNSALLILTTNFLVQGLSNKQDLKEDINLQRLAFSRPGGVAADAFIISIFNAIFTPLMTYFDIFYFIKLIKQSDLKKNAQKNTLSQTEANIIFEGPQVLLYDNYAYVIKTIWITFFFAPLVPISILFCIFGLGSYYWIQKYLLLRRKSRPPLQSSQLNSEMCHLIGFSPILIAAGQLWIDYVFDSSASTKIINFISIGISGLEFFIPFEKLVKSCITWPDDPNRTIKYSEQQQDLPSDYDRINPITKLQALSEYVKQKKNQDQTGQVQINEGQDKQILRALKEYAQLGGEQRFMNQTGHKFMLIAQMKVNQIQNKKQQAQSQIIVQNQNQEQNKLLQEQNNYINKIQQIQSNIQYQEQLEKQNEFNPIQQQTQDNQHGNNYQQNNIQQPYMNQYAYQQQSNVPNYQNTQQMNIYQNQQSQQQNIYYQQNQYQNQQYPQQYPQQNTQQYPQLYPQQYYNQQQQLQYPQNYQNQQKY